MEIMQGRKLSKNEIEFMERNQLKKGKVKGES